MKKIVSVILVLSFLSLIITCSQGYVVNKNVNTDYSEGRDLYLSKCSGCHQLYDPDNYTKERWDQILIAMKEKSKINSEQKNEIYNWILETKLISKNLEAEK